MARRFFPDADTAFEHKMRAFADNIAQRPEAYGIPRDDEQAIVQAVKDFAGALQSSRVPSTRSKALVARKDEARAELTQLVRRALLLIRANEQLSIEDRVNIGLIERPERAKKQRCPQSQPVLYFKADVHRTWSTPGWHVITFNDLIVSAKRAKPDGASRLELFVDLVPLDEPWPNMPGDRHGGLAFYLGSYTRTPFKIAYPKTNVPMRVVYWGRWANNTGETGPFSRPLVAPLDSEMWSHLLPGPEDEARGPRVEQRVIITSARRALPEGVETIDTLHAESKRVLPDQVSDAA
jgi:hypothetical protein